MVGHHLLSLTVITATAILVWVAPRPAAGAPPVFLRNPFRPALETVSCAPSVQNMGHEAGVLARSQRLISPDGTHEAWVETQEPDCPGAGSYLSRIMFVGRGRNEPERALYTAGYEDPDRTGYDELRIIAWSPDSRRILFRHCSEDARGISRSILAECDLTGSVNPVIDGRVRNSLAARGLTDDPREVESQAVGYASADSVRMVFHRADSRNPARDETWEIDTKTHSIHRIGVLSSAAPPL